jgi:hypothetical protein
MTLNNLGLALRYVRRFDEAITAHQDAATMTVTCVRGRTWVRTKDFSLVRSALSLASTT